MIEGNGARPSHLGPGFAESDIMYTVNTVDRHSVAYETPPPDTVFQNTGHGWWTESTVCETVRTPCGGDSTKANLIVEIVYGHD